MDVFQFFNYLKQFNADVILIGFAVWGLSLLLRKTLFRQLGARTAGLMPFLLGIALYAAYAAATGTFDAEVVAKGVTCGSLATVVQVVFGQTDAKQTDVRTACVLAMTQAYAALSEEEAKNIADAYAEDAALGRQRLEEHIGGEAADAVAPLLEKTLSAL